MPDEEKLDKKEAIKRLNAALELQLRSSLQYSITAASLTGIESQALDTPLTEFGDEELADARRLIEKIVSFGGKPTTEVAELRQEAIEPTGREGRSEALEHLMEHLILRKQHQVDLLHRAAA
jgi:bacterioferritin (cytochrome b1)